MKEKLLKRIVCITVILSCNYLAQSQNFVQVIRGKVVDKQTQAPLVGATVLLLNSEPIQGTISDEFGYFRLENVPVGRQSVVINFIGYNPATLSNLIITSAKELVVNIQLEEKVNKLDEITVLAHNKKDPINKMAAVSARSFSVDETQRYAGSWGDPSKMVAAYGGVISNNDSRNDIIIRGNSPVGLIWRLEGLQIPNPNHFASNGATGGPVSILNNNTLANSDFLTAAFPAEYGNGISGAFDLRLRKGNNEKREYIGQASLFGLELGVEGPFSKINKGSYIVNYRYSTLGLLDQTGLAGDLPAIPKYQDLSFKIDLPTKKLGNFTLFGIGGLSNIEFIYDDKQSDSFDESGESKNLNEYMNSDMGLVGLSHLQRLSEKGYLKSTVAVTGTKYNMLRDTILFDNSTMRAFTSESVTAKMMASIVMNNKFNSKNNLRSGFNFSYSMYDFHDNILNADLTTYRDITNKNGDYGLLNAFSQWQYKFSDKLLMNSGVHFQLFTYNTSYSIEPRFALRWELSSKKSLSLGTGLHSQVQPLPFYLYETQTQDAGTVLTNENLEMTKSFHSVIGYDHSLSKNLRLKTEVYYQHVFNIPVEQNASYFSMANIGADFEIPEMDSLVNNGMGENYGIEITLEKFFSRNYYFLLTASLYNSKYIGSDNISRNTIFNGNYSVTALAGCEIKFRTNHAFVINTKLSLVGNKRYLPIDLEASNAAGQTVYDYENAYKDQLAPYFKVDLNFGYRLNRKNVSHHLLIDITNIFNRKNVFLRAYNPDKREVATIYQYPMIPNIIYKIEF